MLDCPSAFPLREVFSPVFSCSLALRAPLYDLFLRRSFPFFLPLAFPHLMGVVVSRLQGHRKVQKPSSVTADDNLDDLSTDTTSSWDEVDEEGPVLLRSSTCI